MTDIGSSTKLIIVTGTSGAGLSTALKFLEDEGIKVVDNIPLALIDQLVAMEVETAGRQLAVGLDARTSGFTPQAVNRLVTNLRQKFGDSCKVVFMSAAHRDLMRRFNTTRRQHPLGSDLSLANVRDLLRRIGAELPQVPQGLLHISKDAAAHHALSQIIKLFHVHDNMDGVDLL